jgi:flagellar motor switch protein FliN/FliY
MSVTGPVNEHWDHALKQLPIYTRSLLRVTVPVTVRLATTQTRVSQLLEMGPGSIIQFDKGCDESLTLEVGGFDVAEGDAVKIGDKFGLRITQMVLPPERFQKMQRKVQDESAD